VRVMNAAVVRGRETVRWFAICAVEDRAGRTCAAPQFQHLARASLQLGKPYGCCRPHDPLAGISCASTAAIGPNAQGCAEVFQRPGVAEFFEETRRSVSAHSIRVSVGGGLRTLRTSRPAAKTISKGVIGWVMEFI
jgi:hypothetical protein